MLEAGLDMSAHVVGEQAQPRRVARSALLAHREFSDEPSLKDARRSWIDLRSPLP